MKAIKGLVYYIAKKKMDDHEVFVKLFEEFPLTQKEQKKGGTSGSSSSTKPAGGNTRGRREATRSPPAKAPRRSVSETAKSR